MANAFRAEVFVDAFKDYFKKDAVSLLPAVTDFSSYVRASVVKGEIVTVPALSLPVAQALTPGSVTAASVTDLSKDITINVLAGHAVAVTANDSMLNAPDYIDALARHSAYGITRKMNIEILSCSVDSTVSGSATAGAGGTNSAGGSLSGSVLTDTLVLTAAERLDSEDAPPDGRFLVITPGAYNDIKAISTFTSRDHNPDPLSNNQNFVGRVRGFNVLVRPATEFVDGGAGTDDPRNCVAFHKDAIGIAFAANPWTRLSQDGGQFRDYLEISQLFGVKVLYPRWIQNIIVPA